LEEVLLVQVRILNLMTDAGACDKISRFGRGEAGGARRAP
jgi:hypothetical protein